MASTYTDKPIDLVAWHGAVKTGSKKLSSELFSTDNKSSVCTGIQKAVQDWLAIMLTPKGSVTFDQKRGTDFMIDIFGACTESEVYSIFLFNNAEAISQLNATYTTSMNPDEKVKSVKLSSLSLYLGTLSLNIRLTSKAGTSTSIILPIDINPIAL